MRLIRRPPMWLALALGLIGLIFAACSSDDESAGLDPTLGHAIGPADAPVTVIEFADYA